jgi:hypothetical protein
MLFLRACVLATLVGVHLLGGAVLFRKLFPRESPWWGFFLPALLLISALNFIEHLVALPLLAVAFPFTTCGSILAMVCFRGWWKSLRLPIALFLPAFLLCFSIKCLQPNINFYNTEGLTDLNRILDFCLGDTVPPQDCWLPPYPHVGYYTFMQYGASVLKRLFFVDVGTAYNVSSALVSSLNMLAGAAAAYTLGRFRPLIAVCTLVVLAGGFTGSMPIHALLHPLDPNPVGSIDLGDGIDWTAYKEFAPLLLIKAPYTSYRIYTPGCYIYYSEFHAQMGGDLVALLSVFSVTEVLRRRRAYLPWIFLLAAPALVFITCTWLVFIVLMLAVPSLIYAWRLNRRPPQWRPVFLGAGLWLLLLDPTLTSLLCAGGGNAFYFSRTYPRDFITVMIQWWPVSSLARTLFSVAKSHTDGPLAALLAGAHRAFGRDDLLHQPRDISRESPRRRVRRRPHRDRSPSPDPARLAFSQPIGSGGHRRDHLPHDLDGPQLHHRLAPSHFPSRG